MDVRVAGHQVDTGESLRERATRRIEAITEKHFSRAVAANVTFGRGPQNDYTCDIVAPVMQGVVLKAHHRAEFYAASMSFDMAQTDKLALFVEDVRRADAACLPPSINSSRADFSVEAGSVRYALGALKGVGEKAMDALVAERARGGPYRSLEDFAERIDPRLLNRRQLESLAAAGAFDEIVADRAAVFTAAETVLAHANVAADQ